jgi:hypothetical protein
MRAWKELDPILKSAAILIVFFILLLVTGKLFVPLQAVDHENNYVWPPMIYSIFVMLQFLIRTYSQKKGTRILGTTILLISLIVFVAPVILGWSEVYKHALHACGGNSLRAAFSVLYVAPLMGGLLFLMLIFGGKM